MRYVVDASIAVKWFFDEEHSAAALRIRGSKALLHAPVFFRLESTNAVCKKIRRGEVDAAGGIECLQRLRQMPMLFHDDTAIMAEALGLALELRRSLYDCLYLALAVELGCQFVTADARFVTGVRNSDYSRHVLWVEDLPIA